MSTILDHYIELRPTRAGATKAYITGTRIGLSDIYVHHVQQGKSAEEIVAAYPHLTLSQVFAALAYCFDHLPEIREELREESERIAKFRAEFGPGPLARKQQNHGDSIPPG
jgi:uncharacterized protein (DUF433 family)